LIKIVTLPFSFPIIDLLLTFQIGGGIGAKYIR